MFSFTAKGDFTKTLGFLKKAQNSKFEEILTKYGEMGRNALASATPKDSGRTASSWGYRIEPSSSGVKLVWTNTNINQNVNIALIIQLGHGTGTGGYVQGVDYINPAIKPIFDQIADGITKELNS